ncbi:stalk domain-containing protein [Thermotalea metallivorans]|uniref:Copper amine oxidase-like N-terminal domain-containing protein n=1 Tax=Thermotalea metallivorans TaxID=520762 RepID=A0A140L3Y5_9FIRM|nr:stalk domain-containing protein [Thermotalea metallivorans]KXG75260.1 hypothetical protein AN619_18250 [Thermotalea metallivorans]
MKHLIRKTAIILLLLAFITSTGLAAPNAKEIKGLMRNVNLQWNNGVSFSANVIFYNERIYVPLRLAAEGLGCQVNWHGATNTVTIQQSQSFQDFPEANPWENERFVYGEILSMDKDKKLLTIEEHYDDHSRFTEPELSVSPQVVIILQRNDKKMNLDFSDLRIGDHVGLVLNKDGIVRGIILNDA